MFKCLYCYGGEDRFGTFGLRECPVDGPLVIPGSTIRFVGLKRCLIEGPLVIPGRIIRVV